MNQLQIVLELKANGNLKTLTACGLVSPSVNHWLNIYLDYDVRITTGKDKVDAISETADKFSVSERTVRNALKTIAGI